MEYLNPVLIMLGTTCIIKLLVNVYLRVFLSKLDKDSAEVQLSTILGRLDLELFIPSFFVYIMKKPNLFIEIEKHYKNVILNFIEINSINEKGRLLKYIYNHEHVEILLDKIYPRNPRDNEIYFVQKEDLGQRIMRHHSNQSYYNRRVVSEEYIDFTDRLIKENITFFNRKIEIDTAILLKVLKGLVMAEVDLHQKKRTEKESYYIVFSDFLSGFNEDEIEEVIASIDFLINQSFFHKVYKVKDRLYCCDFSKIYEEILSTLLEYVDSTDTAFTKRLGVELEKTVGRILSKKYKTHLGSYILDKNNDIDVLVEFGDVLILVEVKARKYSIKSQENKTERGNALKKIKYASKQLDKRMQLIREGNDIVLQDGRHLKQKDFGLYIELIITLEDMFELNHETAYDKNKLILSLDELAGILSIQDNTFQFPAYLFRRRGNQILNKILEMDKFIEFVQLFKKVMTKYKYGFYIDHEIRDFYTVRRMQRNLSISVISDYESILSESINDFWNNLNTEVPRSNSFLIGIFYTMCNNGQNLCEMLNQTYQFGVDETIIYFRFVNKPYSKDVKTVYFVMNDSRDNILEVDADVIV